MKCTALFWSLLTVISTWSPQDFTETCRSPNDYAILFSYNHLSEEYFTERDLTTYFEKRLKTPSVGEIYITASSDPTVIQRASGWRTPFDRVEVLNSGGPYARLYNIGNNAVFEYRDNVNRIGWTVIRGENVLSRSLEGVSTHFIGQSFSSRMNQRACEDMTRTLYLAIPRLRQLDRSMLTSILGYYDSLFTIPYDLTIKVYESFSHSPKEFSFPTLDAIAGGYSEEAASLGRYVRYWRQKVHGKDPYIRRLRIEDNGTLIANETITLP